MIATLPLVEPLRLERAQELLRYPGPCVTITLPPYQPGAASPAPAAMLKTFLQDAERHLAARKTANASIEELLGPLDDIVKDAELLRGSRWGSVLFRAPGIFRHVHLTAPPRAAVTVAGCFQIRPLLDELNLPSEFFVLKLFKDHVALTHCDGFRVEAVPLPRNIPATLEQALALEPPDHDLENRSSAGPGSGTGTGPGHARGVRFGTGSGRETKHAHLADFYKIVDRGLNEFLRGRGTSLVLAGVEEDTSMYRGVNSYPNLVPGSIHGSAETFLPDADLLQHGAALLREARGARQAKALAQWKENVTPARFLTDIYTILPAAFEGRVHKLYLNTDADHTGVFERDDYASCGPEDLLNLAGVQTLLHGGEVCAMPADAMPEAAAAAAILRF
ncbi:MAG TPA: hypothetical protein VGN17_14865 [Bryobacteraceae bacterium]|jgi:hypothetical protein